MSDSEPQHIDEIKNIQYPFQDQEIRKEVFKYIKQKKNDQKMLYGLRQLNNQCKDYFEEGIYESKIHFSYVDPDQQDDLLEKTIFGINLTKITITVEPIQSAYNIDNYTPQNITQYNDDDLSHLRLLSSKYFPNIKKLDATLKNPIYKKYDLRVYEPLHFKNLNLSTNSKTQCELYISSRGKIEFQDCYFENISIQLYYDHDDKSELILENLTVQNALYGIEIYDSFESVNLKKLQILESENNKGDAEWGCLIWQRENLIMDDITVKNYKKGIQLCGGQDVSISGVKLSGCEQGCVFNRVTGKIFDCEVKNCKEGIKLEGSQFQWKNLKFSEEGENNVVLKAGSTWTFMN